MKVAIFGNKRKRETLEFGTELRSSPTKKLHNSAKFPSNFYSSVCCIDRLFDRCFHTSYFPVRFCRDFLNFGKESFGILIPPLVTVIFVTANNCP
jgi:hypothetical protein